MKTCIKRKPNGTKQFCGDNAPAAVDTVLDVKVLDENGEPVDEKTMTEEQINFCAKVATRKAKAFSASKRKSFNADEEVIDVVLPEDLESADIDQIVNDAVIEREVGDNPDEVVVEVELEDETPAEEVAEDDTEVKEFAGKSKRHTVKLSSEDLKEGEKLEEEIKEEMDNIEEKETLDDQETNESDADGVTDIKQFSRGSIEKNTGDVLASFFAEGSVQSTKTKFFAANKK